MTRLLIFLTFCFCLFLFIKMCWVWYYIKNRKNPNQKVSKKRDPTMFDVRNFLMQGEKELAVQLYCQIFKADRSQALKEVEELERSLQK